MNPNKYSDKYHKTIAVIDEQSALIAKKDYHYYAIPRLKRIVEKVDEFSKACDTCKNYQTELEKLSSNLNLYIKGSSKQRIEYEQKMDKFIRHMKKEHKLVMLRYYSSAYSIAGMFAGAIAGTLAGLFFDREFLSLAILSGWAVGLITGWMIGGKRDWEIRKQGRYL